VSTQTIDLTAATQLVNIKWTQGFGGEIATVTLKSNGTPIPLTDGDTFDAQIRARADDDVVLATIACAVVGDGSTGQVQLSVATDGSDTIDLPYRAKWEFRWSRAPRAVMAGDVFTERDVTRG
jgi:hypothetical protein